MSMPTPRSQPAPVRGILCRRQADRFRPRWSVRWLLISWCLLATGAIGSEPSLNEEGIDAAAEQGYEVLRTHAFLPADFDAEVLDALWTVWPEPDRSTAAAADADERRRLIFGYYGIMPAPAGTPGASPALGYTITADGGWAMNCLSCHGGKVAGRVIPGLANTHLALQTLTEDVRLVKLQQRKPMTHLDIASLSLPLNTTNGTTNSVIFGVVLGALRRPDMTVDRTQRVPELLHHDVDAPPFWNVRKKSSLYVDGFAPKTQRPLMQFMLIPENSRDVVYGWEDEFQQILAWIESVEPPRYPWVIDDSLAITGRAVFDDHCARCHGTYGTDAAYEQQTIPWELVRTDRTRLDGLTVRYRQWMKDSWMSRYGQDAVEVDPAGYVAPPLDGIWASAPYFHNGSVPTLWHVLHSTERPAVWKRTEDGYDTSRVGLEIETWPAVPETVQSAAERRRYYDTQFPGKSAEGHTFPDALTEPEKQTLLEYLKSL